MIRWPIALMIVAFHGNASAHVTVFPKESDAGAHEKYVVRVPNEKQVNTVVVEVHFSAGLRVTSFEQKLGWSAEPIREATGGLIGVRWRGTLAPQQFAEFGLLAVNPALVTDLHWDTTQSFADGSKVDWTGRPGSKTPAPHVSIK